MSTTDSLTVAIVGGGQAGFQAAASLRELGFAGTVRIFGAEAYLPYQRPPLSKTYLKDDHPPDKVYLRPERFFAEKSIEMHAGARVAAIDRAKHTLTLANGETAAWDHLVLATGVVNRRLPVPGADLDGVFTLRGLDDAHLIRPRLKTARRIVIVGGGVIGLEVAGLARGLGIAVDIIELGDRLAGRIGSAALSEYFLHFHRSLGSTVHLNAGVREIEGRNGEVAAMHLSPGARVETDLVLVCIGVAPDTALAQAAGLDVRDGIVVDEFARTSDPAILAAGDCTRFKPAHGVLDSIRLESVQNAIDQAKCAAATIFAACSGAGANASVAACSGAGANASVAKLRAYDALPWFWSDQGSLKLQIAGLTAGHDHAIVKADPVKGTMAVYCFANGELIGVECVNRPADFMAARRVLGARRVVRVSDVEKPDFELKAFMA